METKRQKRREETGTVVSIGGDKTCIVQIDRLVRHTQYAKYIRRRTRLAVHDPANEVGLGDTVRVTHCRPISKRKRWRLVEVVGKARLARMARQAT
ncbi:MAG: 30S ribosomal protein S17 [Planctomycetes bacterium]|nr:30S ribosomal protein S17 [Planctomycetota bacterium]